MSLTIHVPQPETPQRQMAAAEVTRRPVTQTPATWLSKFEEQRKAIFLCPRCDRWFNPKAHHYVRWSFLWNSPGVCDRCAQYDRHRKTFIHASTESAVAVEDGRRRVSRATFDARDRKSFP